MIEMKSNAIDAKHFFDSLARSQLPFALSRALNRLTYDLRDEEQQKLHKYMNIRTNWMMKRGAMPVVKSNKRQFPDIHTILGVKDRVAAQMITGGDRKAQSGDVAIPLADVGNGKSARSVLNPGKETITKRFWPSNLVKVSKAKKRKSTRGRAPKKPKPFFMKSKGRKFIAMRSSASRLPIMILFEFKRKASMKEASWPLIKNAEKFIGRNFDSYLEHDINRAVDTMRI